VPCLGTLESCGVFGFGPLYGTRIYLRIDSLLISDQVEKNKRFISLDFLDVQQLRVEAQECLAQEVLQQKILWKATNHFT